MEIKQGDRVRVSKDAPKMYVPESFWTEGNSIVEEIHEDNAAICYESNYVDFRIVVPIKYLLVNVNGVWKKPQTKPKRTRKADAEANKPKFKIGDKVTPKSSSFLRESIYTVMGYCEAMPYMVNVGNGMSINENELEPYTEPTEHTEAKTKAKGDTLTFPIAFDLNEALEGCDCFVSIREQIRKAQRDMEENHKPRYVPKIMFNTEFWVKYEADLAKEIALKVANKYNDPEQAAEYAVLVAKAVVEGLKRK